MDNVFDEKLAITHLADCTPLCSLARLMVNLRVRVDPRLGSARLAVAQPTIGAVDHLVLVLERMST